MSRSWWVSLVSKQSSANKKIFLQWLEITTMMLILVKLITKSNSSLMKMASKVPLRQMLKFHSEILLAQNRLLLLVHSISQSVDFVETKQPKMDVHLEIFQSLSEKLPIQQTVQSNYRNKI